MTPENVMETLKRVMLVDGYDLVLDLERSSGSRMVDARSGRSYLDMFSMFASQPLGFNHPRLAEAGFQRHLGRSAIHKPSNSDIYTQDLAEFVDVFTTHAAPRWMRHLFLVSGGALAVENALKVAFDWKVRKNLARGKAPGTGSQVIHFKECFHGRSGYTLSLTNTDPNKTLHFPRFQWPRVSNPKMIFPCQGENLTRVIRAEEQSLAEIESVIGEKGDDIAALILEPIQGEGGDHHFRPEFLSALRLICDKHEIFFILDEVQTGLGMTGQWWAHQHHGVEPDAMAFGKKTQVCGIAVSARVDEVQENCFTVSSRINSTWGGNLVDMVRSTRIIQVIHEEGLLKNAADRGAEGLERLTALETRHGDVISNVRGQGLLLAFDLVDAASRPALLRQTFQNGLLLLACGSSSIRLRPALNVTSAEMGEAFQILERSLTEVTAPEGQLSAGA